MSVKFALAVSDHKAIRHTVNYHPRIWGDRFTTLSVKSHTYTQKMSTKSALTVSHQKAVCRKGDYHRNHPNHIWGDCFTTLCVKSHAHTKIMSTKSVLEVFDQKVLRRTADFHPNIWGDHFMTYVCDDEAIKLWREEAEELKEKVRKMLKDEIMTTANLPKKLKLIDAVQRLGVSYHFEEEIDELLEQIFINHKTCVADYDLHDTALLFRLQRQQGSNVSCDVFKKFRDHKGSFKGDSVGGTLSLYEAAHLRVHGEDILDEALDFATTQLNSVLITNFSHPLAKQIQHALRRPIRKSTPRLEAWHYMSFYKAESESHDENLLKFAKLDFNILQKMHQKEMSILARWWKDLDFRRKLSCPGHETDYQNVTCGY
ncbi:hypothetical protein Dimus_026442 [Dionaea muscipula]